MASYEKRPSGKGARLTKQTVKDSLWQENASCQEIPETPMEAKSQSLTPSEIKALINETRKEYYREYQKANPDKVKRYQAKYWLARKVGKAEATRLMAELENAKAGR